MSHWVAWVIAAGVLAVGEILTLAFVLGPLAIAAAITAASAALGLGIVGQLLVFAGASLASLIGIRPIARRHSRTPATLRTGVAALTGRQARVLDAIGPGDGRIKLAGEVWSARALDPDAILAEGTQVTVVEIDGATAVVIE
ncbi:MAG TPA: NfeD family protein [Miltoncostaeales bacterium]|jgi:membrane protein implicated in regulation of membrane protease activity|nr:NfeD family protein [Miltoncostaeales bacterium]